MQFFTDRATPFINQGNGSFAAAQALHFGGRSGFYELRDLNADGRSDLVATTSMGLGLGSNLRVYLAGTDGVLNQVQEIIPPASGSAGYIAFHDFSGDGRSDLVATVSGRLVYYAANADGTFGSEQTLLEDLQGYAVVEVADVNADGRVDLLGGGAIRLATNGGGFENPQEYWLRSARPVLAKDINGDQLPDLITADSSSQSLKILLHR
jgi:hypothetical protein